VKKLTFLVLISILSGCVSTSDLIAQLHKTPKQITIGNNTFSSTTSVKGVVSEVRYKSYLMLTTELKEESNARFWSADKFSGKKAELKSRYPQGRFIVTGYASTIGAASNGAIEVLLIQNNQLLLKKGMDDIAETPSHNKYSVLGDLWWNLTSVNLKKINVKKPFELRVVNTITNTFTSYKFSPGKILIK
jgi:hypothetical protein